MKQYGFLAIWCEVAPEDLTDYRNWLMQEHIADRTFSPGFLGVRLFENVDNHHAHFILYATDGPDVLNGPDYRSILDNPSPWTRRIMPKFGPFDRALGTQIVKIGNGFGTHLAIWQIKVTQKAGDLAELAELQERLAEMIGDGIISLRICALNHETTVRFSEEKTMRDGKEGDFDYILCAEAMTETSARHFEAQLAPQLGAVFSSIERADSACYRMIYGEGPHEGPILK